MLLFVQWLDVYQGRGSQKRGMLCVFSPSFILSDVFRSGMYPSARYSRKSYA
jgi:hypothetical protein